VCNLKQLADWKDILISKNLLDQML